MSDTLLGAALEYAAQGIAIMPCRGKRPALSRTGEAHAVATSDADQIREWWTTNPRWNIGIACTANRLAVIDIDGPAGVEWIKDHHLPMPTTWTATTGRGHHYYYRWPEGETIRTCQIAPKLEIRAAGAYVIAPPSIHPDGDTYRWAHSTRCDWDDIPELPPEWITLQAQKSSTSTEPLSTIENTAPPTLQPQKSSTIPTANTVARKRLAGLAHHLATTPKGERHSALYTISRTLGGLVASNHLTVAQIHGALYAAAETNGLLAEDGGHNVTQTITDGIAKGIADGPDLEHHETGEHSHYTLPPPEDRPTTEPDGTEKKNYVLRAAASVHPEEVEWFHAGRVPLGALTLLVGTPGLGKTTYACELAARGTRGELESEAADVIFVSAEDAEAHTLVPRFTAAQADLDRVHFMKMIAAEDFEIGLTLPDDIGSLQDAAETTGANLIVLDPVVAHLSGDIDSYKDHSVRRALAPLAALAENTGAAILGIMHLNKSQSTDVVTRVGGSVAFGAAARSVLLLGEDPDAIEGGPERLLIHGKSNLSPLAAAVRLRVEGRTITTEGKEIETSGMVWLGEDPTATAAKVLRGNQEPSREEIATDFLRTILADGALLFSEIRKLAADEEITLGTLKRASKRLGIVSKKGFGTGATWELPLQWAHQRAHPSLYIPQDEPVGGPASRKALLDKGFSNKLIGSEKSTIATNGLIEKRGESDEPIGEPIAIVLEVFPGAEVVTDDDEEGPIPW